VPSYSAFAFQLGLIGAAVLLVIGLVFQSLYPIHPGLFRVIALTSLTIPAIPMIAVMTAALGLRYRFRDINVAEMQRALVYYLVLVAVALAGAEIYTIALASLAGTALQFVLLRRLTRDVDIRFLLPARQFLAILRELRWIILAAFLAGLAMRSDQLALARLIDPTQLGFYTFGFLLVISVTIPVSAGINQVFLPVFSRLQADQQVLRREVMRFTTATVMLGALLCLALIGVNAAVVHLLWGGKWDGAQQVITVLALATPFRFLATISAAGLESYGRWGLRNTLLAFETLLLFVGAALGAHLAGLAGAIVATGLQRVISGIIGFGFLAREARIDPWDVLGRALRIYLPFGLATALLFGLDPARHGAAGGLGELGLVALETLAAMALYLGLSLWWNREIGATLWAVVRARLAERKGGRR
jgi:O-antigen/teichoic acid export membrane protein